MQVGNLDLPTSESEMNCPDTTTDAVSHYAQGSEITRLNEARAFALIREGVKKEQLPAQVKYIASIDGIERKNKQHLGPETYSTNPPIRHVQNFQTSNNELHRTDPSKRTWERSWPQAAIRSFFSHEPER
jgi:hypothetical protein